MSVIKFFFKIFLSLIFFIQFSFSNSGSTGDSFVIKPEDGNHRFGSVYYTSNNKNDVLFKVSIWGNVQFPGVHYLPLGTRFLEAISIAGGPLDSADFDKIKLSSRESKNVVIKELSIGKALENSDYNPILKADDIVLIPEDKSVQKTTLYLQIGTFILSAAAFGILLNQKTR